jgi:glycosyltransferase involved in cell wall biosynthesis
MLNVMRSDAAAVIPAYNCDRTIGPVVEAARRHVGAVVVIDDGSVDGTAAAARQAGARVESLLANRGKGFALRRGIEAALALAPRAIVLLDGDGQHDAAEIPTLLAAWEGGAGELVIGTRWSDPAAIPPARYWTNYVGSRILSWMTGTELLDSQSGFRVMTGELARRLPLRSDGYAIESEMLIKAARLGARIGHVPVRAIYDGCPSHFRPVTDTFRISCEAIYFKVFDDA